jgi:(R,R)-butanediol dehydrogenase/meso-butanediol dehydrogenase/diacetyl reductase
MSWHSVVSSFLHIDARSRIIAVRICLVRRDPTRKFEPVDIGLGDIMRAALFQGAGKPLVVSRVREPERQATQVVIQVSHCGICGSDLHLTESDYLTPGTILGHEFSGVVVEAAPDGPAPGTRVTALPFRTCMQCDECAEGYYAHCAQLAFVGIGQPGAFAEYVAVPHFFIQTLPAGVSFELGALVEPLAVAHHAVELAGAIAGKDVLILGGGPIGAAVIVFARLRGARKIMVSEPTPHRRALGVSLGASAAFDPMNENIGERFTALAGRAPDVVIDCAGIPGMLEQAIALVRHRGEVIIAGAVFGEDRYRPARAQAKEVTLRYSLAYTIHDFAAVIDALAQRRIDPEPMLTSRISLEALPAAFEALRQPGKQCKMLVDMHRVDGDE